MAIPFFMLAGGLMEYGGISKRLMHLLQQSSKFTRRVGIDYGSGLSIFGAISGSNPATVAAIGGKIVPAMIKKGTIPHLPLQLPLPGGLWAWSSHHQSR
jgi:C4-dicarboxylate transporter DctM subunit